jgi:hypothetical protein
MDTFLFFLLVFGYVCLLIWGLFVAKNHSLLNLSNVLLLVILALVYDNLIIASGRFIGEGAVLENLSYVRFWLHALFTPTLILFAAYIYFSTGLPQAKNNYWKVLAYTLTIGLIIYELFTSVKGLKLEPTWKSSVLTYDSVDQSAIPFMIILITLVLGAVGLLLMIKFHFFWLFIGVLITILGSILTSWIKYYPMMNVLEFLLIVSLLLTKQFLVREKEVFNQ